MVKNTGRRYKFHSLFLIRHACVFYVILYLKQWFAVLIYVIIVYNLCVL